MPFEKFESADEYYQAFYVINPEDQYFKENIQKKLDKLKFFDSYRESAVEKIY